MYIKTEFIKNEVQSFINANTDNHGDDVDDKQYKIIGFRSNMRDVAMELAVVVNVALWGTVSLLSKKFFYPSMKRRLLKNS